MENRLAERKPALEEFLAEASGAEGVEVLQAKPLSGGAIQENWLLDISLEGGPQEGRHALVLRTDSPSGVAVSLSRAQEFKVLRAAFDAGVKVPEPLWLCEDPEVLGRPFYLMRRAQGVALGSRIVKDTTLGGDRRKLVEQLGAEMARIHSIKPPREDIDFLDMPEGNPAFYTVQRNRAYLDQLGTPRPALEWGLRWCERHAPESNEIVLVHQDFRTGNYMIDEEGLTAVLDWEFAAWGDPMSDLGWFCARCWRFGRDELEAGGIGAREDFYRGYTEASGREVDDKAVRYWEVIAHIRWAVIALQQGARHVSGAEPSLELALTGRRTPEMEFDILEMTAPNAWEEI
jgi:aminoglycoside phosphotransferase (APT) family kinase protein